MKVTPIGIYGPYPKGGEASSCYLVESETTKVALDFGSGALSKISQKIDPIKLDAIILSHLHFDHFVDVLPLAYAIDEKMKLYCPASPVDCFSLIKNRAEYDVSVLSSSSYFSVGDLAFEFLAVKHPVETYAIKVTGSSGSFVYTGDTMDIGNLVEFCRGSKYILCDCAGEENSPHLRPEQGFELMEKSKVQVIMTHINPKREMSEICKKYGLLLVSDNENFII